MCAPQVEPARRATWRVARAGMSPSRGTHVFQRLEPPAHGAGTATVRPAADALDHARTRLGRNPRHAPRRPRMLARALACRDAAASAADLPPSLAHDAPSHRRAGAPRVRPRRAHRTLRLHRTP